MQIQNLLLAILGTSTCLVAVLGWLLRTFITHRLQHATVAFKEVLQRESTTAIERLKNDLQSQSAIAVEQLKNSLQIRAIEHQIRFSKMHERQAEIIAEIYRMLVVAISEAESFLSPISFNGEATKQEKHVKARQKLGELFQYYSVEKIYVPSSLCNALEKIMQDIQKYISAFGVWTSYEEFELTDESQQKKFEAWQQGYEAIQKLLPAVKASLENEFRKILGSEI